MSSWNLVLEHRFQEAANSYRSRLDKEKENPLFLAEYSTALLCLGRLQEALAGYQRACDIAWQNSKFGEHPYMKEVATVQWLLGDRAAAIQTLTAAVDGILDGAIKYADQSGGATQGLQLWYMGITAKDSSARYNAEKYLRKLTKKPKIQYWPGPLARFVLGDLSFEEMLESTDQMKGLSTTLLLDKARSDLFTRRHTVQALFYLAVMHRSEGEEEECHSTMKTCAGLENPIIELEWYLARAEALNSI